MPMSRRAQRRERGRHHARPQEFATFGKERDTNRPASRGSSHRDPSREREKLDEAAEREAAAQAEHAGAEKGFGKQYGQGFGMGAGRGPQSGGVGLEGQRLEERDYRGNAGTTFGAPVGPDALKEDTSQDKRDDPKPAE